MGDSVVLEVDSSDAAWIARTELATLLGGSGRTVLAGGPDRGGAARWSVRGLSLEAGYRNARRPALFAGAVVDREIAASMTSEIVAGGRVLHSGPALRTALDTVSVDLIPDLEAGAPESGRGRVPDMETLDRFVEPLVIIGAAGVAIFLFFQVRS